MKFLNYDVINNKKINIVKIDETALREKIIESAKKHEDPLEMDFADDADPLSPDYDPIEELRVACTLLLDNDDLVINDRHIILNPDILLVDASDSDMITTDIYTVVDDKNNIINLPYKKEESLLGFHSFNGKTVLGVISCGEFFEEDPVFLIFYFDGNNIRCYVPFCGNNVNMDFGTAFGSEYLSEVFDYKYEEIEKKYRRAGIIDKDESLDEDIAGFYIRKYFPQSCGGSLHEAWLMNWNGIRSEIEKKIT